MSNGIIILRNSDFVDDTIMKKKAESALKNNFLIFVLGWDRTKKHQFKSTIQLINGKVNLYLFQRLAKFGSGFGNFFNIIFFNFWIFYQLYKLRNKYDNILSMDLDTVFPSYLISVIFKKKIIFDIIDNYSFSHQLPSFLAKVTDYIENFFISSVDHVIVCNESRKNLISFEDQLKTTVIHNTPDISSNKFLKSKVCLSKSNRIKIVYVGTLHSGRLILEIASEAFNNTDFELHIAGFGPFQDELKNIANSSKNIFFYGRLSNEKSISLQKECDILFATYDPRILINKHSAPLKLYEAMLLSKPIIVCKGTTSDLIVQKYNMGSVINYNKFEFWESAKKMISNPKSLKKIGLNSRKAYDNEYNWNIMEHKFLKLFIKN